MNKANEMKHNIAIISRLENGINLQGEQPI